MEQILNKPTISNVNVNSGYLTPAGLREKISRRFKFTEKREALLRGDLWLSV